MFILDTNVISELRRRDRADSHVKAWVDRQRQSELFLSVTTILEIEIGARRIARRDPVQASLVRRWIDENVLPGFRDRILPVDVEVVLRCAPMHVPDKRPDRDAFIAATALVHGMTVVTRNTADFAGTGVEMINPWVEGG